MKLSHAEAGIIKEAYRVKQYLADNDISYMSLQMEVSGRTTTDELKFEIKLFDSNNSNFVTGGSLQAVLDEFVRRVEYKKANEVLLLPSVPEFSDEITLTPKVTTSDDDIQF